MSLSQTNIWRYFISPREMERYLWASCHRNTSKNGSIQSTIYRCDVDKQKIDRVFNLIESIAGGGKWQIEDAFREELTNELDFDAIHFDEGGNLFYNGHFVSTVRAIEDETLWKNRKLYRTNILQDLTIFYARLLRTLLVSKEVAIPDRELIIMVGIKYLDVKPTNPVLSHAIVEPFKNKDDKELEKLPREIRKLLKFYYVPESTRRNAKTDS